MKKFLLAVLFAPLAALAQTYPSPTFQNLTVLGTSTVPYSLTFNNPSATTVAGKLNQIVNFTDFAPHCDGSTADNTAWSNAISTIGSTPTTLIVSCPSKISAGLTFAPNTQLDFQGNGKIVGTSGSEVVQVQQQILAGRTQIFSNLTPQADVGMTVYPEWFGGSISASDSSSGFNSAYSFLQNVGGIVSAAAGTYTWQHTVNVKANIALIGAGQGATNINVTGTNVNGINVAGSLGTPLALPSLSKFSITSATPGTSNIGINLSYTALATLSEIQVNNFFVGIDMECATNTLFDHMGTTYTSSVNGFIGWDIYGNGCTGGNASSVWRDTYVQGSGAYSGPTGQIGYHAHGNYVSDLYFDNAQTAETNYGYYFDYSTATAGGYADVIIHNPVVDGFTTQAIFANAIPAQQMLTILGGWLNPVSMLAETDGIYCNNCVGSLQASNVQIGGEANYAYAVGVRLINTTNAKISGSAFNDNKYAIQETGSSRNVYTGNSVYNTSAHSGSAAISVTGSSGSIVSNNTIDGYNTYGILVDATSSSVSTLNNTINSANIGTPIQNSGSSPIGSGWTGTGAGVLATSPSISSPTITGSLTATGLVTTSDLATQAANTVLANVTGSTASPTAFSMPSCSGSTLSALQWTSGTGFTCATPSSTGSGSVVLATSPTLTTPNLGTPSAVTLTNGSGLPISSGVSGLGTGVATALGSAVTGSGGPVLATSPTITTPTITGVTSGSCASSGNVGQCVSSNIPNGSAVSLSSGTASNVTSISLTAGNWIAAGNVCFSPAGSTTSNYALAALNTVSAPALPTTPNGGAEHNQSAAIVASNGSYCLPTGTALYTVSGSTTLYLVAFSNFSVSTMTAYGYIFAMRFN
ncbi:hypothetical protein AWB78_01350 [Caballeronia calidae]|uniref:Periplasmic copper-binding protein NosD beta helix domain-containing protein n=1 Tax=Caballeronia calidae TaxID=1777139 RepID=A0A158A9B6_9BURK|nr:NosD domain-containing protein [Caballeronia calidae]SAK53687.1 hypothetical protein AWB78_01350 [Caballeronia calidae]